MKPLIACLCFVAMMRPSGATLAQACPNRGQLDDLYCDADRDMVADAPTDKSKWKNPSALIFTYTPIEDPAVKHDQSILDVNTGDYDAAAIADDVLERMSVRGVVKAENFRTLYVSPPFVTSSFAYAHDLDPALAAKIRVCFMNYKFTPEMTKEFNGDDRFHAADFKRDWAVVRKVAEDTGTAYNRAAFDREAAAAVKK